MSAPLDSRRLTSSEWPPWQAKVRAVSWLLSVWASRSTGAHSGEMLWGEAGEGLGVRGVDGGGVIVSIPCIVPVLAGISCWLLLYRWRCFLGFFCTLVLGGGGVGCGSLTACGWVCTCACTCCCCCCCCCTCSCCCRSCACCCWCSNCCCCCWERGWGESNCSGCCNSFCCCRNCCWMMSCCALTDCPATCWLPTCCWEACSNVNKHN